MVDMAHDGHDRGARFQILRIIFATFQTDLDIRLRNALHCVAEFLGNQFCGVRIDNVISAQHFALLDHEFHDVTDALIHPPGKVLQRDRFWQGHLDGDLFALVVSAGAALTFAFTGTAQ